MTFSTDTVTERKAICAVIASREFMRMGGAMADSALRRELSGAVTAAIDGEFVTQLVAAATTVNATGSDARSVMRDAQSALDVVTTSNTSRLHCLMRPAMAKRLCTMTDNSGSVAFPAMRWNGGTLLSLPVTCSDAVASGAIIIVDASQCVASGADDLNLRTITQGDVIMDTAPDSPPTASTVVNNLWQRGEVALVCERRFTFKVLTDKSPHASGGHQRLDAAPRRPAPRICIQHVPACRRRTGRVDHSSCC